MNAARQSRVYIIYFLFCVAFRVEERDAREERERGEREREGLRERNCYPLT